MSPIMNTRNFVTRLLFVAVAVVTLLFSASAYAATPGITGASFSLDAHDGYTTQPDGASIYSWGYGCAGGTLATGNTYLPAAFSGVGFCPVMQMPGPTLIVAENQTVTVTLTNNLPASAGNTSILFPGFQVSTGGTGVAGLLTQEAVPGGSVTYTLTGFSPGTHSYYSGTQGDLQIEMGLYGAIIVLPAT